MFIVIGLLLEIHIFDTLQGVILAREMSWLRKLLEVSRLLRLRNNMKRLKVKSSNVNSM